jgi:hypothetical protein
MNACASARVRLVRSMPLSYSVLPSLRLLCIRGWGVITQRDDALCDFSEASSTPTMAELRGLVELMAQQLPARGPRKLAIITSKPITFVVAGEFKEFVKQSAVPMDVEVFPDFQSGWTWLRPEESQDSKTAASHR